jgi:predicted lactoylglutathione lyase
VKLPVKDLNRSAEFFTKLGFSFNQQFTDETATCMIPTNDILVMLLTEEKFRTFTPKEICDAFVDYHIVWRSGSVTWGFTKIMQTVGSACRPRAKDKEISHEIQG